MDDVCGKPIPTAMALRAIVIAETSDCSTLMQYCGAVRRRRPVGDPAGKMGVSCSARRSRLLDARAHQHDLTRVERRNGPVDVDARHGRAPRHRPVFDDVRAVQETERLGRLERPRSSSPEWVVRSAVAARAAGMKQDPAGCVRIRRRGRSWAAGDEELLRIAPWPPGMIGEARTRVITCAPWLRLPSSQHPPMHATSLASCMRPSCVR